ncbi:MAG: hypothetical protein HKL84_06995 [Acidimicrobiaceae bacterium]|nr:hypothetical protein [Acidimicrobiaceae bacterium]
MQSFLSHAGAKGKLAPGTFKKRIVRTTIGYLLLAVSIATSLMTLAVSLRHSQITVFQVSTPVASGEKISLNQIHQIKISSSNRQISSQFATAGDLAQMVTNQPLVNGQLIEVSDLSDAARSNDQGMEMNVPLASSKAPLDQIYPGDYIELISTIGSGSSATSRVVAAAAKVLGVFKSGSAFGQMGQNGANVLLTLNNPVEAIAIAQAETAGSLVAVRVAGSAVPAFQGTFSLGNPTAAGGVQSSSQTLGVQPPLVK